METTKKRTREEVRMAFKNFMKEREKEQIAAQLRHKLHHQGQMAEA